VGARCACCRTQEHTFQKVLGELVHTAAEEEVGKEKNSFDLEGKMYCNDGYYSVACQPPSEPRTTVPLPRVSDNGTRNAS